ncbi:hypothetical protein BDW75DRAFT_248762 [Aspergillus navahoensis]
MHRRINGNRLKRNSVGASLVSLLYYASDLPSILPTETEIDDAQDIALEYRGRRIIQVGHYFVVKFRKEITNIPVPWIYALYTKPEIGKNYIVMEQPQLTSPEKDSIMSTMRVYFDKLRNLPPPEYYGSLGGRSLDEIFWTHEVNPAINGPFTSEDALNEAFALKYVYDDRPCFRAEFYRQKNIIVQRAEDEAGVEAPKGIRVVLLDWEKSGWYPSYWEYCLAVCALQWDNNWYLWVEKILDLFVSEAAWLQMLCLELWL